MLSPILVIFKMTLRIAFTHSSRLAAESADNLMDFSFVRRRISFSLTASQLMAYRRSTTPCGKYGSYGM